MSFFMVSILCLSAIGVSLIVTVAAYKRMRQDKAIKLEEKCINQALAGYSPHDACLPHSSRDTNHSSTVSLENRHADV